jgi:hypothetical protein
MQSPKCQHCQKVYPNWTAVCNLYSEDESIILAEADCEEEADACTSLLQDKGYPAFFTISNGVTTRIYIDHTIEVLTRIIEHLKKFDRSLPCTPWFHQPGRFPLFGFSFVEDDRTACQRLTSIMNQVPHSEGRFLLGPQSNQLELTVALNEVYSTEYNGTDETNAIVAYAKDYVHLSLTDWPIEECDLITQRRFGFMIYANENQIRLARQFAMLQCEAYCFALMDFIRFQEIYENSGIEEADLPLIAVLNRAHTHFAIVGGLRYDDATMEFFENWAKSDDESDMIFEFLRPWEEEQNDNEDLL